MSVSNTTHPSIVVTDTNGTADISKQTCLFPFNTVLGISRILLAFLILLINGFMLYVFARNIKLRKLSGNFILTSLSVSDFLHGLLLVASDSISIHLFTVDCNSHVQYSIITSDFPSIFKAIYKILMLSSILHLLFLSTDRLIYIVYALKYNDIVTRNLTIFRLALVWIIAIFFGGLQLSWTLKSGLLNQYRLQIRYSYAVTLLVLFLVIPSVAILMQSVAMVMIIRRLHHAQKNRQQQAKTNGRKAFALYGFMYLQFLLFSYPPVILNLLNQIGEIDTGKMSVLINILLFLRSVPSLLNPCLYALHNKDYKAVLHKTCQNIRETIHYKAHKRNPLMFTIVQLRSDDYLENNDNTEGDILTHVNGTISTNCDIQKEKTPVIKGISMTPLRLDSEDKAGN